MPTGVYVRTPRPLPDPLPRFWSMVQKTSTCWLWTGGVDKDGYGRFWFAGANHRAHVWIFERMVRPLEGEEQCCHSCDTPGCVRYDLHLYAATQAKNIQDCWARNRASFNAKPQPGTRNGNSKLTEADVRAIRERYHAGEAGHRSPVSLRGLAREYGVSKFCIQSIVQGQTWRHLLDSVTV